MQTVRDITFVCTYARQSREEVMRMNWRDFTEMRLSLLWIRPWEASLG